MLVANVDCRVRSRVRHRADCNMQGATKFTLAEIATNAVDYLEYKLLINDIRTVELLDARWV